MPDTPHDIPRYVDPAIMRADLEEAVREWMNNYDLDRTIAIYELHNLAATLQYGLDQEHAWRLRRLEEWRLRQCEEDMEPRDLERQAAELQQQKEGP
jgi:hypothetical protein